MLAWLPNSVIPNHHYSAYSYNGSYLIFAPAMIFSTLWAIDKQARRLLLAISIIALASPALSTGRYTTNKWILEQQHIQKRLLSDLAPMLQSPPPAPRSVLVTGIDFSFSPFDHPLSLHSLGILGDTQFSVVTYAQHNDALRSCEPPRTQPALVRFITPEVARCGAFDEVWMFRNNGSLIRSVHINKDSAPPATLGFTPMELMIFPGVAEALGVSSGLNENQTFLDDGHRLYSCGVALMSYQQPELALRCLQVSSHKLPTNPYPYFYSGVALERLHRLDEAKLLFESAISHDDPNRPNPVFIEALLRSKNTAAESPPSISSKH
jgi:hypothetical protein